MAHQWHAVFHDALTRSEIVGVQAAVRAYLRREPTRSEMNAARRAVTSFAAVEPVDVYTVPAGGKQMLLLARPGTEVDAGPAERAVLRQIRPGRPRRPDTARLVATIERGVETAVEAASRLDIEDVEPDQARELAALLDQTTPQLTALRMRLKRQSNRRG